MNKDNLFVALVFYGVIWCGLFGRNTSAIVFLGNILDRLAEQGWLPFKFDSNSKMQPNYYAKFILGGNHDRTIEMAFMDQTVNLDAYSGR